MIASADRDRLKHLPDTQILLALESLARPNDTTIQKAEGMYYIYVMEMHEKKKKTFAFSIFAILFSHRPIVVTQIQGNILLPQALLPSLHYGSCLSFLSREDYIQRFLPPSTRDEMRLPTVCITLSS